MSKASTTRHIILEKAFEIIYTKGYQTTSIDEIIATTNVTKGAFYYHFKTKDEMGLAIINEILKPTMQNDFVKPLQDAEDPILEIYDMTKALLLENPFLKLEFGCPAGNLTQEMTPWNVEFGKALAELTLEWQQALQNSISTAQENGTVREDINPIQVAYFIMSGYWGIRNFAKVYNSIDCYHSYLNELKIYLNNLR
ncbi:TetR/AcrR family transcriptional regulator [Chryseobacterium sp. LC2016-29]|uniref:TetR/AcrR family transcriptional regulator n=1 Tax=Chryseobacterium sp. LC2016-29 TaxID=2897331 RepID=UPI001E5C8725|nr:TetR/AcrR family transcriptional regulator [Chryseobacterium sp. LC2016-29]MCD0477735.1 TetR/AcrR family transcriptional regulator [Chryseobacterium sp. LC2016-29]